MVQSIATWFGQLSAEGEHSNTDGIFSSAATTISKIVINSQDLFQKW